MTTVLYCGHCGRETADGVHDTCRQSLMLEPPRYCDQCRRRMIVQVHPMGWTARCSVHGELSSDLTESYGAAVDNQADDSVLAPFLGQVSWSAEEGVSYEVALEGINQVIGAYSGLIGRAESAAEPDEEAIENWTREQLAWADRRRSLSPTDPEAVQAVRQQCITLLATLRATE